MCEQILNLYFKKLIKIYRKRVQFCKVERGVCVAAAPPGLAVGPP